MTIQVFPVNTLCVLPFSTIYGGSNPTTGNITLDAANEKYAMIFKAQEAFTVDKVRFLTRAVTTGAIMDVRIETIDGTTGHPSGTLFATNTNIAHTIDDTDDSVWLETSSLTASASISKGDLVAVVIVNPAVSPGNMALMGFRLYTPDLCLLDHFTGSWLVNISTPAVALLNSSGVYMNIPGSGPYTSVTATHSIDVDTTPDELGMKFQVPWPVRVEGIGVWKIAPTSGADFSVVLYDAASGVLATQAIDASVVSVWDSQQQFSIYQFDTPVNILADTTYRIVIKPTTNDNITIRNTTFVSSAGRRADFWPEDWVLTERTNAGSWSEGTGIERPFIHLLVSGFDDGAGGGAASILSGGFGL